MSWFDASGFASLAKNALKEAQKTIDKALDIKDDNQMITSATSDTLDPIASGQNPSVDSSMKPSQSHPVLPISNVWGSFSGSFFDNPNANPMKTVTTPPSSSAGRKDGKFTKSLDIPHIHPDASSTSTAAPALSSTPSKDLSSGESGRNSSESVEVVSPPTTPGSSLTSPGQASCSTIQCSESVEVIDTPTSELASSADSVAMSTSVSELDSKMCAESVEIISDEYIDEEISLEEDSMSFDTVMESSAVPPAGDGKKTGASHRSGLFLSLDNTVNDMMKSNNSISSICMIPEIVETEKNELPNLSSEEAVHDKVSEGSESQTQLSDSTQSFEYIQRSSVFERSGSPHESDERSDIVKVTSDHNSGHTSADEVETTTSSDIEIISSPNGDSSSTNSAYKSNPDQEALDRLKKKGHCRELSQASTHSIQSDDSRFSTQSETEKLLRKISDLSEILEAREYKLMELGRENAELHKRNCEMKSQMDNQRKRDDCIDMTSVTEEYTQRMSAIEKKFQQSIRERDSLRDQLKAAKVDLSEKVSREAFDKEIGDKNFLIQELKSEGEKLSIQILQHSNIIKKLRAKERETDSLVKKQKEEIEGFVEETERLKKSLSAKEEMERTHIEAVHKLSSEKRKLDKENAQLKSQLDDTSQKLKVVQKSFEAAKKELLEKQEANAKLSRKADTFGNIETEKQLLQSQNQQMMSDLANLRDKLRQIEHGNTSREQILHKENVELMRRLQEFEMRNEEQAHGITESTIPLIRQLESLQSTLNQRTQSWESQEKSLMEKLNETQRQLEKLQNFEQQSKAQLQMANTKLFSAEERLSGTLLKQEQNYSLLQQKTVDFELMENELKKEIETLKASIRHLQLANEEQQGRLQDLQQQIDVDQELVAIERRQREHFDSVKSKTATTTTTQPGDTSLNDGATQIEFQNVRECSSPALSVGHESIADSLSSNVWPLEDMDCISNSGRPSIGGGGGPASLYGSGGFVPVNSTSYLENLQAILKQRDGENHQLQWELSRLQADRNFFMSEVSNLTMQLETQNEKLLSNENLEKQFNILRQDHEQLVKQHAEKMERLQEIQLDLYEAKEVYKSQLDDLLRQLKEKS